ncbi:cupredoxin family protein [Pseudomonas sp. 5P_3.1_Bac2]|uniref:cupredoxin domain-containing protein n=1 Tax=Pseudomonas sp. 5P_3.1_Bac2 TaxID=2971617 RepID=UPI0021C681BC|nr:cupredoxin family protein [Pseudomonas sp. 5P_3.1_Bac2]MCU1716194.1 cupredoxin family protein [Pseudomonas sp. 5P_3.1_Bac2]
MRTSTLGLALLLSLLPYAVAQASMDEHAGHHAPTAPQQATVDRSIAVTLNDNMRFSPEQIQVKQGETIRFVLSNQGQLVHEFVLGSAQELAEHAAMMASMPGMQHTDAAMQSVEPGSTAELVWTFNRAGKVDFACLLAGHFQAGMRGQVEVLAP